MKNIIASFLLFSAPTFTASANTLTCDGHSTRMIVLEIDASNTMSKVSIEGPGLRTFATDLGFTDIGNHRVRLEFELNSNECAVWGGPELVANCFFWQNGTGRTVDLTAYSVDTGELLETLQTIQVGLEINEEEVKSLRIGDAQLSSSKVSKLSLHSAIEGDVSSTSYRGNLSGHNCRVD